jgi:hypothetical protein
MDFETKVIKHQEQRYNTVGDWYPNIPQTKMFIRVSDMKNQDYNFLVMFHEIIESYLCHRRKISEPKITEFDVKYEAKRPAGDTSEPGDDPEAPYRKEHFFATSLERLMAAELGVDWGKYDEAVQDL